MTKPSPVNSVIAGRQNGRPAEPCYCQVRVSPALASGLAGRAALLERIRPLVARHLEQAPGAREFDLQDGPLSLQIRMLSGRYTSGSEVRLSLQEPTADAGQDNGSSEHLSECPLPCPELEALGSRLVGLEPLLSRIQLELECRWGGQLARWQEAGAPVPEPLVLYFRQSAPLFILAGRPGTGKSSVARVSAERFCREHGLPGTLLSLEIGVRGSGLVGDFSRELQAAFAAATRAADGPSFLLIDEAEAIGMRRSERQSHQEDRAATAALLQCLDGIPGGTQLAVFATSNLEAHLDPALLRRGVVIRFDLPDRAAREELIGRWLPSANSRFLGLAAAASRGMTPADIDRAGLEASLSCLGREVPLSEAALLQALRSARRTQEV